MPTPARTRWRRAPAARGTARGTSRRLYTEDFLAALRASTSRTPTVLCRATDHIREQIDFIADLERNGYTYTTSDGVYFDTAKQPDYGHLARLDVKGLEAGRRVERGREAQCPPTSRCGSSRAREEHRQMEWDSPWGRGFPGWHIECSAMAQKYLGDYFDIHCGGEDHIPVHHTNEIAQTEARVGTRLANFWMHGYFLLLNDAKMAKSAGEFLRVQSLVERGYDPLVYRYLCLTAHYRTQMSFTWDAMDAAATALDRHAQRRACAARGSGGAARRRLPRALHRRDQRRPQRAARARRGVGGPARRPAARGPARDARRVRRGAGPGARDVGAQAGDRSAGDRGAGGGAAGGRRAKQWAEADRLRGELAAQGWDMDDQPGGYRLKRR